MRPTVKLIVGKKRKVEVLVDSDIARKLQGESLCIYSRRYVCLYRRKESQREQVPLHHFVAKPSPGQRVDHVNDNGFDNRRVNLRCCSHSQNLCNAGPKKNNKTGFKGVCSDKRYPGTYVASICKDRKTVNLGSFTDKEAAARAYDKAALELHAKFARLNFPSSVNRTMRFDSKAYRLTNKGGRDRGL